MDFVPAPVRGTARVTEVGALNTQKASVPGGGASLDAGQRIAPRIVPLPKVMAATRLYETGGDGARQGDSTASLEQRLQRLQRLQAANPPMVHYHKPATAETEADPATALAPPMVQKVVLSPRVAPTPIVRVLQPAESIRRPNAAAQDTGTPTAGNSVGRGQAASVRGSAGETRPAVNLSAVPQPQLPPPSQQPPPHPDREPARTQAPPPVVEPVEAKPAVVMVAPSTAVPELPFVVAPTPSKPLPFVAVPDPVAAATELALAGPPSNRVKPLPYVTALTVTVAAAATEPDEPLAASQYVATDEDLVCEGYLVKIRGFGQNRKRWFRLTIGHFYCFTQESVCHSCLEWLVFVVPTYKKNDRES
jgi:hypothetical protein